MSETAAKCPQCGCDDPECGTGCVGRPHNWMHRHTRAEKDGAEIFTCARRFWRGASAWYRPSQDAPWSLVTDLDELRRLL